MPNTQVLDGRSGILGELRHGNFVDVVCSRDSKYTYAITANGILCLFSEGRALEKWIDLHIRGAYSLNLDEKAIICSCSDGIIRLFEPETLEYIGTLPKPSPVGTFAGNMETNQQVDDIANPVYPDVLASQYDASSGTLICICSDRSLYVWDIHDYSNPVVSKSHIFHSDCVWGAEVLPSPPDDGAATNPFPADTFLTYSADGSIKFWNLDDSMSSFPPLSEQKEKDQISSHPSKEVLRVLYVDRECQAWIQVPEIQDGMEPGYNVVPLECGIRTIRISSDGRYLASGDKGGNLRVHDLLTLEQVTYQEAHDTEILTIDFTDPTLKDAPFLLATAGRDRLLHVFDIRNDYALLQTLDDHSSSITCIRFTADGSRMMSCGADKSIVFRNCQKIEDGLSFQPYHQAPGRATFYDMGMHDATQTISVVAGDRRFNVFSLETGKPIRSFKADAKGDDMTAGMAEVCSMTHICLDPTGTIAAASGSDKSIRIYDLLHGTCLAHMVCHSELVTSLKFMSNYERIISTSADGCVLVWRVSKEVVKRITSRIQENITLPSYMQTKTAEKLLARNTSTNHSSRPQRAKKLSNRLSTYASDHFVSSRRGSTTSLASEDCEVQPDESSERVTHNVTKDSQRDDTSKESFSPVTAASVRRASGPRARVTASISKTTTSRSRHSSSSQPSVAPSRSGTLQEQSTSNKSVAKEKTALPPSSRKSPGLNPLSLHSISPRPNKSTLLVPSNPRPRATSLTVPTEKTLKMDGVKAKDMPSSRQVLSDYTQEDPPTAPGEDDDSLLSDDTQSGIEDKPTRHSSKSLLKSALSLKPSEGTLSDPAQMSEDTTDGTEDHEMAMAATTEGSENEPADESGASEEPDRDDDDADDSVSDTGSDNEILSPRERRNIGLSCDTTSFGEGEFMKDSPASGGSYQVTSPNGRMTSMRPNTLTRSSLSTRFLAAHAASVMMGLVQSAREEKLSAGSKDDPRENAAISTPTPEDPHGHLDHSKKQGDLSNSDKNSASAPKKESDALDRPLEERLNLQSLNMAALKWKQRSLGNRDGQENDNTRPLSLSIVRPGLKSEDYSKEVERTRQRLLELGYLPTQGGTQQTGSSVALASSKENLKTSDNGTQDDKPTYNLDSANSEAHLSSPHTPKQAPPLRSIGILASPALVTSPEGMDQEIMAESLDKAIKSQFESNESVESKEDMVSGTQQKDILQRHQKDDENYNNEQDLRGALERISSLISHHAVVTATISAKQQDHVDEGEGMTTAERSERIHKSKQWMLQTREGLLNLVGEVQGHLWALERSGSEN
ncbi:mitogen-activated protein kinase binding protein 1 [Lobosporangium transversale]|nr:mitogen-activated protein kinase binding protein 1 [Lobosporangium transversale]